MLSGLYWTHAEAPAGKIILMKGRVFIVNSSAKVVADPEGKRGRSTQVNSNFYVGETVQTKGDGRVKLAFFEGGNEVVLGPDTALTIEKASTQANQKKGTDLNLARGEVRSEVKTKYNGRDGEVFQVKTPNAVAGIRGTIVYAKYDTATAKSDFACLRGSFEVKGSGASAPIVVNAGMSLSADKDGRAQAPMALSSNPEMQKAAESLGGNGDNANSKKESDQPAGREQSRGVVKNSEGAAAPAAKDSGSAPMNRETVATESDSGANRKPASVPGAVAPAIMGADSSSGANVVPSGNFYGVTGGAVDPGTVIDRNMTTATSATTQSNAGNTVTGTVHLKIN